MVRSKRYNIATHILTTGRELISRHLEYILNAICHEHAQDIVNSITLNANIPKHYGSSMGSAKAISINLVKHFTHAVNQTKECPQHSVRGLLILELVNTCLHETRHLMLKSEPGIIDDDDTAYQEDDAVKFEEIHRWNTAKYANLEIVSFGPVIDDMMAVFYKELTDARDGGTINEWQEQQLYMIDNGILYHDTRNSTLIKSVFDFFRYFSKSTTGWDRNLVPVFEEVEEFEETTVIGIDTPPLAEEEAIKEESFHEEADEDDIFGHEETPPKIITDSIIKEWKETAVEADQIGTADDDIVTMDVDGSNNYYETEVNEEYYDMSTLDSDLEAKPTISNLEESPVQAAPKRALDSQTQTIVNITQLVIHRLFNHIYSKCGWNNQGEFTNPNAVLDPVSINDIKGAASIFTHADTHDALGNYTPNMETNGMLKGVTSVDNLPMYKLHLTINGQTVKRTFIPQNPNKTKESGQPTAWAKKVKEGHRLALLLPEVGSAKLYVETIPGQVLGQEKLTICDWNK